MTELPATFAAPAVDDAAFEQAIRDAVEAAFRTAQLEPVYASGHERIQLITRLRELRGVLYDLLAAVE